MKTSLKLACLSLLTGCSMNPKPDPRPNVLFIAVDDLRTQINAYGDSEMITPNLDALASNSMTFTRAYCNFPVCGPSRTSIMTGLRPDRTGVYDNDKHFRSTQPGVVTLSQAFKNQGYQTRALGKIYHHTRFMQDSASWTAPAQMYQLRIQDEYFGEEHQNAFREGLAQAAAEGLKGWNFHLKPLSFVPPYEMSDLPDTAYMDGKIAMEATRLLKKLADSDQPFFLGVGFHKPHLIYSCPKKYWDLYDEESIPEAPNKKIPENYPDYYYNSQYVRAFAEVPDTGVISDGLARKMRHGYYACVSFVDHQIGIVMQALEESGEADNTIVVLWGDHGYLLNDHGIFGKHNNFEEAVNAPLIIAAPGKARGERSNTIVEFIDIYPTLCELAGIAVPDHADGKSLVPVLSGKTLDREYPAYSQYPAKGAMGYSVRTDRYRYTEWRDPNTGKTAASAMFDYSKDPYEKVNIVSDPGVESEKNKLKSLLNPMIE